jgi:hypothetical protein
MGILASVLGGVAGGVLAIVLFVLWLCYKVKGPGL